MKYNKNHLLGISGIMMIGVGIVAILAWGSISSSSKNEGFNRKFITTSNLQLVNVVSKPDNVVDFAGNTRNNYFFRTKMPGIIYMIDTVLKMGEFINITIPDLPKKAKQFYSIVDSPHVKILLGNVPSIVLGDLKGPAKAYNFPGSLFTRSILISPNSFVLRMFDKTNQVFVKYSMQENTLERENNVSEKNNDAGISTDGLLNYDKINNLIVYTFRYYNQFICLDTNLNFIYRKNTIDNAKSDRITVSETTGNGMLTNSSPKKLINYINDISNGYLFNVSKINSVNEDAINFNNSSVVDVYAVENGNYVGSFYIPDYDGQKLYSINVNDGYLCALYKKNIVRYLLPVF